MIKNYCEEILAFGQTIQIFRLLLAGMFIFIYEGVHSNV
ncbi:hypothetical protein BPUTEOMOX_1294 [methanotrophic endosymbiont of Bathymodiolus puteoserpentis (Logatchev)]|nr:hypothetical protein BPUTEOMOX_1294 [methanotrophic endosymbiont of Bathymodiolus puteoserpentis (Logatchev)]